MNFKAMKTTYDVTLTRLDTKLDSLVQSLSGLTHQQLNARPEPGAWSVLQVMQHLLITEKMSVSYVRKKMSKPQALQSAGLKNRLRSFGLKIFLALPFKFKAPAIVSDSNFPAEADFNIIIEDWRRVRSDLAEVLSSVRPAWQDKELFKHALVGKMTLDGMLSFFENHFDRHLGQIEKTVKKVAVFTQRQ
jgi:uncharacterized damage-inducible protein DinB